MNRQVATEVFLDGFGYCRSLVHPTEVIPAGRLRVLRDQERSNDEYRTEEVMAVDLKAAEIITELAYHRPRKGWCVCAIHGPQIDSETLKAGLKLAGFRARTTEPLFIRDPAVSVERECSYRIRQVLQPEDLAALRKAERGRLARDEDLVGHRPRVRIYAAFDGDQVISWVRSIGGPYDCTWVAGMYTVAAYRRKGIGAAVMATMLRGDHENQVRSSVLLASNTGAKLYRSLGYQQIGVLQLFSPPK